MKKVLFLINNLAHGGAERVLVNLANNMDKTKFDITVQTLFDEGVNKQFLNSSVHYRSSLKKSFKGNSIVIKMLPPCLLYKFFIKEDYDVVVAYLEGSCTRILSGCKNKNTKKVTWVHIELNQPKLFKSSFWTMRGVRKAYNSYDKIVCVAQTVKDAFVNNSGVNSDTLEVLYNTNQTDRILTLSREPIEDMQFKNDIPNICSVAKIIPTKGYDRLLNVHKKLLDEGYKHRIYLIGIGEQIDELKQTAAEKGVAGSFVLLGFKENPYKYMKACDAYVCSSRREGFSTAVTEALVLGLPTVSTNCSGAVELLGENNDYGLVVDNSEEGIYEGMKKMLSNTDTLLHYKKLAEERGKAFKTDKTVRAVEDMLENLFNN